MQKVSTGAEITHPGASRRRRQLVSSTGIALVLSISAGVALADTLRWDSGNGAGFQSGDGNWNLTEDNWRDNGTPAGNILFQNGDSVVFGGPDPGATVTLNAGATLSVEGMTFTEDDYTIDAAGAADRIGLVPTAGGNVTLRVTGTNTATIEARLSDQGRSGTVTVDNDDDARLVLTGDNGGTLLTGVDIDVVGGTLETQGDLAAADVTALSDGRFVASGSAVVTPQVTAGNGGTVVGAGGDFAGGVLVQQGGTYRVTGNSTGDVTQTGGTVTVTAAGTLDGSLGISAGTASNDGTITGAVTQSGGSVTNDGDVGGSLTLTGGQFTNSGGAISGNTIVNNAGAVLVGDGGDFAGGLELRRGTVNITGNTSAEVTHSGGAFNVRSGGLLQGNIAVSAGSTAIEGGATRGEIDGAITQTGGTVTNGGIIRGGVTITAGRFSGDGSGDVRGLTAISAGGLVVTRNGDFTGGVEVSGGEHRVSGNSTGNVRQTGGNVVVTEDGRLDGRLTQSGAGTAQNSGVIAGDVIKSAGTLVNDASGTIGTAGDELRQSAGVTNNRGGVVADAFLSGGTFNQRGGNVSGDMRVTGGRLDISGGRMTGEVRNAGGTINVTGAGEAGIVTAAGLTTVTSTGALTGAQRVVGGTLRNDGQMEGSVRVSSGTFEQAGVMAGTVRVTGGTARQLAGSDTRGTTTVTGGLLRVEGGQMSGGAVADGGGRILVTGAAEGDITVAATATDSFPGGDRNLNVTAGGRLTGNVTVAGGTAANDGRINGRVSVTGGDFEARQGSTVTGASQVTGGTITLRGGAFTDGVTASGGGRILVRTAGIATSPGAIAKAVDVNVGPSGTLDIGAADTLEGTVTATGGTISNLGTLDGTLTATGGTTTQRGLITGDVSIGGSAVMNSFAGSRIDGQTTVVNGGQVIAEGGNFAGGLAVNDGGFLDVTGTVFGPLSSAGTGRILNRGTIDSRLANGGTATGGGTFAGVVANSGIIHNGQGGGNLRLAGGLRGGDAPDAGIVDLTRATETGDEARIGGAGVSGGQTFRFNVDLDGRTADRLVLQSGASLTGNLRFELYEAGRQGDGSVSTLASDDLTGAVVLAEAEGGGTLTLPVETNLPFSTSRIVLGLDIDDQGRLVLESDFNPAFGAIVGNIVLTQSLIGSVINRPTSAAFTPLQDAEDPCGPGMWGRLTAGQADATGTVTTDRTTTETGTDASFSGILLGGDFSCSRGVTGGVNFAVGGILGLNQGSTEQPISASIFSSGGETSSGTTSINEADFTQTYLGAYGVFTRGPLAADLQFRLENTDFDISNVPVQGSTGLFGDTSFSSEAHTLSGAVTYTFPIPDTEFAVTPRVGFSWTNTSTDEIRLSNPEGGADDILRVDDFDNQVGFLGVAVSRSRPLATNDGGTSLFLSGTYYSDFASDPTATLIVAGDPANTESLTLTNLGSYGEISAGWAYVRQLTNGVGGARQLSATIRGDARTGGSLDSWGLTGQLRLQF
jgi:hypothetical protein